MDQVGRFIAKEAAATVALVPLTPKGYDELMAGLPATVRAEMAWARQELLVQLERFFSAPALSESLVEDASAAVMKQGAAQAHLSKAVFAGGQTDPEAKLKAILKRQLDLAAELPVEARRPGMRALLTWLVVAMGSVTAAGGAPLHLDQVAAFFERPLPELLNANELKVVRVFTLGIAILHALETGRAREPRMQELVALADRESHEFAKVAAELSPGVPEARLPWYFQDAPLAAQFIGIAPWAEARTGQNDRARALLESWLAEPHDPEETERWQRLKVELDRDRASSRPLFPWA